MFSRGTTNGLVILTDSFPYHPFVSLSLALLHAFQHNNTYLPNKIHLSLYASTQASLMVNTDSYQPHLKPVLNQQLTPQRYSFKLCKFTQKQPLQHFVFYILQYFRTAAATEKQLRPKSNRKLSPEAPSTTAGLTNLSITPFSTPRNADFKYSQKMCLIAITAFLSLFKRKRC